MQWNKKDTNETNCALCFFNIIIVIYYLYKSIYYKSQLFK